MRGLRQNSGFTLIEVVIVMAITAVLLGGVIAGKGTLFQNSAFTSAMDDAQTTLRQIGNEASQSLSTNATAIAGQSTEVVFGRLAQLTNNSSTIKTYTLVGARDNTGNVTALAACDEIDSTLQDGVIYQAPAGTTTRSLIFTRSTNGSVSGTGTGGQLFVAPPDAPQTALSNAPACSSDTPAPPVDTVPSGGVASPCGLGTTESRAGTPPVITCIGVAPPAPNVVITDDVGDSPANSNGPQYTIDTTTGNLTITIHLTGYVPAMGPSIVKLYKNGSLIETLPVAAGSSSITASPAITLAAGDPGENFTATWQYGASGPSALSTTVTAAYPNGCNVPGLYVCGLAGSYYPNTSFLAPATSVFIDKQVGCDLVNGTINYACTGPVTAGDASSSNDFIPTLETRTGQADAQNSSVRWAGQIYLNPGGGQSVCVKASPSGQNAAGLIVGSSPTGYSAGSTCATNLDGGASGQWVTLGINYTHVGGGAEGSGSIDLYDGATGIDILGTRLRTSSSTALVAPPPTHQGLNAYYSLEASDGSGTYNLVKTATVNGVGSQSSPATWPNWGSTLQALTGGNAATQHLSAVWVGWLNIPVTGHYQFCTGTDDETGLLWLNSGTWLSYYNSYYYSPPTIGTNCGANTYITAGQYPIEMINTELSYQSIPPNQTSFEITIQDTDPGAPVAASPEEIPLNWYTTQDTYLALNTLKLPTYQQYVDSIETQARRLPATKPQPARTAAPSVAVTKTLHAIAQAIEPGNALAACAGTTNILDPSNYLNDCLTMTMYPNPITGVSGTTIDLPVTVPGSTASTQTAYLKADTATNTISWSNAP